MAARSFEERLADIEAKENALKLKKKKLKAEQSKKERNARTKRLIEVGAIVEKYCGEIQDLEAWSRYIEQYANAIKRTQTSPSLDYSKIPF